MDRFTLEVEQPDGSYREVTVPTKWEICDGCQGEGQSSAYLGAFTASEWAEEDQEFQEDYFAGRYDRACEDCKGSGKVKVIDDERCDPVAREAFYAQEQADADMAAERAAERRFGC